ncbi:MAG: GNAT family N-acetyltransferase [Lachnospiraceae bacterium]|nr:GNAT family N-acetyltransferase [Lachnospiraceae bacterium]
MNIEYKDNVLTADDYLFFIEEMDEEETTKEQAELTITNQVFSVSAVKDGTTVGMARLLGDAAIFWLIVDVWVLPEYQGQGIGQAMVERLSRYIKENAPKGYHALYLMCAKGKEGFYEKLGFDCRPNAYEGSGMEMEILVEV